MERRTGSATEPNGTRQRQRRGCMLMVIGMAILLSSVTIASFFIGNMPVGCAPGLPVLFHSITSIGGLLFVGGAYLHDDAAAGLWRVVKGAAFVGLFLYLIWPSFDCLTRQMLPRTAQLQVAPTEPPLTP